MYTRLALASDVAMTADEYNGMKLLMKYGDGDYQKAYEAIMEEITEELQVSSVESFGDIVKDVAMWIWKKITELWDMFIAWTKKMFSSNVKRNNRPEYSVFTYGQFPPGYRPSEFENGSCKLPGWTGTMDCCYMRSVRTMELFIGKVENICNEITRGNVACFFKRNIAKFDNAIRGDYPMDDLQNILDSIQRIFDGVVSFNMDAFISEARRIERLEEERKANLHKNYTAKQITDATVKAHLFGAFDLNSTMNLAHNCISFVKSAQYYAVTDPYSSTSGWDSGVVYKDFLEDGRGRMNTIMQTVVQCAQTFRKDVIDALNAKAKAYSWIGGKYADPDSTSKYPEYGEVSAFLNQLANRAEFQAAERYGNLCAIAEMFKMIISHLLVELQTATLKIDLNAKAISNDVNYQKDHTGNLSK